MDTWTGQIPSTVRVLQQIEQVMDYVYNTNIVICTRPHGNTLSNDAVQLILSFTGLYEMRLVCKKWRDLCLKNEEKYFNALYAPYRRNPSGRILIVHPRRRTLNSVEKSARYQGPFRSIRSALIASKDGDALLIHPGRYNQFQSQYDSIRTNVTVIGMGSSPYDVIWEDPSTDSEHFIQIDAAELRMRHLTIKSTDTTDGIQGALFVSSQCRLSMTDCILQFHQTGVMVRKKAALRATHCRFTDGATGIEVSPMADSVVVEKCMFHNLGQMTGAEESVTFPAEEYGCIQVFDDFGDIGPKNCAMDSNRLVSLECANSVFEDNLCYPVVERSDDRLYLHSDRCVLRRNELRGYNATMTRRDGHLDSANELYHCLWG